MTFRKFLGDEIGLVRFKGNFNLDGLLKMMYKFLKTKGYNFYEPKHKAKIPELEIKWIGERKVTPYYKYVIEINIHFYDLTEVDAQDENGNAIKMSNGRFVMSIDGGIDAGYTTEWGEKKSHFRALLKKFYEALTMREFMAKHAQTLILEATELRTRINSYLGMVATE
ncbi:MAG: hypothetical protein ACLFTR_00150 [Candidatus Woesearchaeota archaeon]